MISAHSGTMKKSLIFLFFIYQVTLLWGQNPLRDSLRYEISHSDNDSLKVKDICALACDIAYYSPDSLDLSLKMISEAISLANSKEIAYEEMRAYYDRAWVFYLKHDLEKSRKDYEQAIRMAEENQQERLYHIYQDRLTTVLFDLGLKDEGLEMKYEVLAYFKATKDTLQILSSLGGLVHVYFLEGDFEKAKSVLFQKLDLNYETDENIESYGNLGIAYFHLGDLDSAEYYMTYAGEIGEKYPSFTMKNQYELARVLFAKGEKIKAVEKLEDIHNRYPDLDDRSGFELKILLAEYLLSIQEFARAKTYFEAAGTSPANQNIYLSKKVNFIGSGIHEGLGNYQEALNFYKEYKTANDEINELRRDSAFQDIDAKYQLSKKEELLSAQKLRLRNLWLLLISMGAVMLIVFLFYQYRNEKQKYQTTLLSEKNMRQELEIESLRKEHQIVSMQAILESQEEERRRIAQDLHDNIGSMMAAIKLRLLTLQENSQQLDQMVSHVADEVRRISHNMTPLAFELAGIEGAVEDLAGMLHAEGMEVESDIQGLGQITNHETSIMVYRIFQELINNIIKHADATRVLLSCKTENRHLLIRIADNGKGLDHTIWEANHQLGLKSIKSRVEYLNGTISMNHSQGTEFLISIPFLEA